MSAEGYRIISIGETTKLSFQSLFRDTTLYPQAKVYKSGSDTVDSTVNLSHIASSNGFYRGDFTPSEETEYDIIITPYTDSGYTTVSGNEGPATIKIIAKDIISQPKGTVSMGGGMLEGDIESIIEKTAKEVWKIKFDNGKTAKEELMSKSEFNVEEDIVKTDIPPLDFSSLKEFLDEKVITIESSNKKLLDSRFEALAKAINEGFGDIPQFNDKNIVQSIKDIRSSLQADIANGTKGLETLLFERFKEIIRAIPKKEKPQVLFNIEEINKRFNTLEQNLSTNTSTILQEAKKEPNLKPILKEQEVIKDQLSAFARLINTFSQSQGKIKEDILEEIVKLLNQLLIKLKDKPFGIDNLL